MPRFACLPLALTVLAHAALSVDARVRTTAPLLSFYDFDPASQSELLPGMVDFGIDPPIDCMLGGYYGYGIPGLFRLGRYNITWGDCWPKSENGTSLLVQHGLPQSQIFAEKGLFKNWRANVALTASMIKPLMAAGAVKGVFLGDEQVCGGHQTMAEVRQVSDALRSCISRNWNANVSHCEQRWWNNSWESTNTARWRCSKVQLVCDWHESDSHTQHLRSRRPL